MLTHSVHNPSGDSGIAETAEDTAEVLADRLAENFESVENRIRRACRKAGRDRSEITVIAVSKTVDARAIAAAAALGQLDFGENYVKPAREKVAEVRRLCGEGPRFHMIGHLQRNKAGDALAVFDSLHSLDSVRLLKTLDGALAGAGRRFPCFIEVNAGAEESKTGIEPGRTQELLEAALETENIEVVGLMTMAPFVSDPEEARPVFSMLRELRDALNEKLGGRVLRCLSMGMTNDFEVAVEEGATHLRIGTALFKT
jgi:pyridoxal phosphate enzyme (YggS family)